MTSILKKYFYSKIETLIKCVQITVLNTLEKIIGNFTRVCVIVIQIK